MFNLFKKNKKEQSITNFSIKTEDFAKAMGKTIGEDVEIISSEKVDIENDKVFSEKEKIDWYKVQREIEEQRFKIKMGE